MRNIKFRVWRFSKYDYFTLGNILTYHKQFSKCVLNGLPFEQYTGLKDKKGVEIYEGDVVTVIKYHTNCIFCDDFKTISNHEVVFDSCMFGLVPYPRLAQFRDLVFGDNEEIEVIGNIHEQEDK